MIDGRERRLLGALVGAAFLVRLALAFAVPPLQAPDERAHLHYVETLAATGRLPVAPELNPRSWTDERAQYYQPPLAYVLYVPLARVAAALGAGRAATLRALRIQACAYGAAATGVGYAVAALLTPPGDPRRWLVGVVLAFFPGFAANASAVNNDALANLLAAFLWWPLLGTEAGWRRAFHAGFVLGAACLAKLSVLVLAPLLLAVPLVGPPAARGAALRRAAGAAAVAALVLLPWAARNWVLYGDPLGVGVGSMSFAWLATLLPDDAVATLARPHPGRAFLQFWGQFGIYNNVRWEAIPLVLVPLAAVGAAGWAIPRRARDTFAAAAPVFALAFALAAAGLTYFSLRYHAAWQGRYLYTAMLPAAALLAGGWARAVPARWHRPLAVALAVGLLALDLALAAKLHRFFIATPAARWGFDGTL